MSANAAVLNRDAALDCLSRQVWDIVVIGGGATGLGAALDAVSRGYRTLLLEQNDFSQGTSSRSTKLIHGGVRYLRQGNVSLVRESLHERGLLLRNAPGLVRPLEFIVPTSSWLETLYYAAGLKAYDFLAGRLGMAASRTLTAGEVLRRAPTLSRQNLAGGVSYFDAQFDDSRLALAVARAVVGLGGTVINYAPVVAVLKCDGRISGVVAKDHESGRQYEIASRSVINATGIFSDRLRQLDDDAAQPTLRFSQGIHIVVDRAFLPGDSAIIVPSTDDGRVLFLIPWHGSVLIGTTDTPVSEPRLEPRPFPAEIEYLLDYASRYLAQPPRLAEIRSCFSGLRPLVSSGAGTAATSTISRDHVVQVSPSGLVTISGGKWTTFRKMGADAVATAARVARLPPGPSRTESLRLNGIAQGSSGGPTAHLTQAPVQLQEEDVVRAVREEMARRVEDVLARRTRLLFVDARAALESAPLVARVMARELSRDAAWISAELASFELLAHGYLPS